MINNRIAIPAELERQVKVEAGHRCAIPTCRAWPVELVHIASYSDVRSHSFENLIALCPTCHARYDNTKDIDRQSMRVYKANLAVINSRFMELEKRLLEGLKGQGKLPIPGTMSWVFSQLEKDELIEVIGDSGITMSGIKSHFIVQLTSAGKELVNKWFEGKPIN